jgi:hypothetical protein
MTIKKEEKEKRNLKGSGNVTMIRPETKFRIIINNIKGNIRTHPAATARHHLFNWSQKIVRLNNKEL